MQGDAATRTTSLDGRWVYTLYTNPGGTPFIHALDTERGVAHCIGIPWTSPDQNGLLNVVLTLHGDRLAVHWRSGRQWLDVDTASWRVSPAAGRAFPVGAGSASRRFRSCSSCSGGGGRDSWERFRRGRRNTPVSVQGGVMFRRLGLVLIVLGALAVVPVALGAYPSPYAAQGGQGVMSKDGSLRYVALKSGEDTTHSRGPNERRLGRDVAARRRLVRRSDAHVRRTGRRSLP